MLTFYMQISIHTICQGLLTFEFQYGHIPLNNVITTFPQRSHIIRNVKK